MSKTRNKTHSEIEHLRAEIRKLNSENRRLKRQVRDLEKHTSVIEEEISEYEILDSNNESCKECGKGFLVETDIGKFTFIKCSICDFKQRKKSS